MNYKEVMQIALENVESLFSCYNFVRLAENQFPASDVIAAWKGTIKCEKIKVSIIVAFPLGFPDNLPKIYLTKDFKYLPMPHVDKNLFVCTFDAENIDFFAEKAKNITKEVIEKARKIISDGIYKRNQQDFIDEFFAYWNESTLLNLYSIIEPCESISEMNMGNVACVNQLIRCLVGEKRSRITDYVKKMDHKATISDFTKCLYFPLPVVPTPPFPTTNKDIFFFLRSIDESLEAALLKFLIKNNFSGTVIASVKVRGSIGFIGWRHKAPKKSVIVKGFRPGKLTSKIYKQRTSLLEVERYSIERIDGDRLQRRIGNFDSMLKQKRICIIGVGSIGSNLAFDLAKSGAENLILVDPENLKPENVARHLCGMRETGSPKVQVIKKFIEQHLPHVKVEGHPKSLHQILMDDPDIILRSDLIISATGATAIERRLNKIQHETPDCPSILYTWIEPYGVAAHAVLINADQNGGCFECCLSNNLSYRFSVGMFERGDGIMQEGGCQTTFTPYSSIDTDQASSLAARLSLAWLTNKISQSTCFVWIGDLDILRSIGVQPNPLYEGKLSFSLSKFNIQRSPTCRCCGEST